MRVITRLAIKSLINRKVTVLLTMFSLTLSLTLFLSIDSLRNAAKSSFFNNVKSGDLILGSRSGEIQLLLYSLFQIGSPTNNISWESYKKISQYPEIDWIIPISLGDSHKQFRVMGTTKDYFEKYTYRKEKKLQFENGKSFNDIFDVVIGYDVAKELEYKLEDNIIIAHGISSQSLHDDFPFKIKGVLKRTGTSVDKLILVSLEGLEAIHKDWKSGSRIPTRSNKEKINYQDLEPKEITAAVIKIKSPIKIFMLQRKINNFLNEPLQAIIPGIALTKLWQVVSVTENVMLMISTMVIFTSLIGMVAVLYSSLHTRKKELVLLRIVGASPNHILSMLVIESLIISVCSIFLSILAVQIINFIAFPFLDQKYGLFLEYKFLSFKNYVFLILFLLSSFVVSMFPGIQAFKKSINDGMK